MDREQKRRRIIAQAGFALAYLLGSAASAFAQESPKTGGGKWRPKEGVYAEPGANFKDKCLDFGDSIIELTQKTISGGEEECKVVKLADTAPGTITLEMACVEINRETPYKEIILLKKIDEKTIFLRETQDGKFKRPGGPMSYCSEEVQRMYVESKKRSD